MPDIVISTENLHKFYGTRDQTVHALRGVGLSIEEGEIVGVMGPSGCGKTTLLNCLSGLDSIDEGNILIQGKTLTDLNDDQFCIDLASKNMDSLIRILKPRGVITTQVGSQDKKPKQVKNWLNVFNKNFGNATLDRVYIPSFDCSWNFSSSINH